MSPRHLAELLPILVGGLCFTNVTLVIAWIRARERAIRAEALLSGGRANASDKSDLAPALDAIAFEVERIGEGQRFLTRVLSSQSQQSESAGKRPAGSITPH